MLRKRKENIEYPALFFSVTHPQKMTSHSASVSDKRGRNRLTQRMQRDLVLHCLMVKFSLFLFFFNSIFDKFSARA